MKKHLSKILFPYSSSRLVNLNEPSVWILFNELALKQKAINLVSGFPNWDPPSFIKSQINPAKIGDYYYYGDKELLETISNHYKSIYQQDINAQSNILVTPGANYAINTILYSYLEPGDEVVSIEPFYSEYFPETYIAGGIFKGVPLIPPSPRTKQEFLNEYSKTKTIKFEKNKDEWKIDFPALKRAITSKTKILMINNPNNPTGKIFTDEELSEIAEIVSKYPNLLVISDEVYEKCYFKETPKVSRFANQKNMWSRTISILSAGKIFACTGIRVGWAIGPENLIEPLKKVHYHFGNRGFLAVQKSVAEGLKKAEELDNSNLNYFDKSRLIYEKGRDSLIKAISQSSLDLKFWIPQSGYFVICDFENIKFDEKFYYYNNSEKKYSKDYAFTLWMGVEKKVVGVPCSVFYSKENKYLASNLIRLACCKTEDYFEAVIKNLN